MEDTQREIIQNLEKLNWQMARQDSLKRRFAIGVVYGIGFFIGSAILATILVGISWPWVSQVSFIRNSFEAGGLLLRP